MRTTAKLFLAAGLMAVPFMACTPTTASVTPITPATTSSTTGSTGGSKAMCDPCVVDTDCGEVGVASCISENVLPGGHCAPVCSTDADCGPGASCLGTSSSVKVCYPSTQTCQGYNPDTTSTGATSAGATSNGATTTGGTTSNGTTGATTGGPSTSTTGVSLTSGTTSGGTQGTTTGSSTTASSTTGSSGGSSGSSCPGYADPNTPAPCNCSSGHTCGANNCYGGWYCRLSDNKCVAPPSSCSGNSSTSTSTSSSTTGTTGSFTTGTAGTSGTSSSGGTTGTGVGPHGGSVSLLHFAISGDTRPPSCEDTAGYPTAIINSIGDAEKAAGAQFALDLGDHMYVCNNDASIANQQMSLFVQGTQHFGGTWFMTEGNHECMGSGSGYCPTGSSNVNFQAFLAAISNISSTPYYSVNIQTSLGLATFVFVADNSFDNAQQTWLQNTLATADSNAKYTIIAKHHPEGDSSVAANSTIMSIIRQHKFALLLTGHAHKYEHQTTDSGRDLVLGNGGAPLISSGTFNGYGMIDQLSNGQLQVSIYDVASGSLQDQWSVGPN
ncbi:MAG: metallophosphoesterase [Deltaproteobacteria bacterium]|nr:metallophosphoesterase [Deltaproteobacteria bacterium]